MSVTYSLAKRAAYLVTHSGTILYALFEKTCDGKASPRNECWHVTHFGTGESCTQYVIESSHACIGGSLQDKEGSSTVTGYIKRWRNALANPVKMSESLARVKLSGTSITIPSRLHEDVRRIMSKHNASGQNQFDIADQPELMMELLGAGVHVSYLIERDQFGSVPEPALGYSVHPCKGEPLPPLRVFKMQPDATYEPMYWLCDEKGARGLGGPTDGLGVLMDQLVTPSEVKHPGSAEHMYRKVEDIFDEAKEFAEGQRIVVRQSDDPDYAARFKRLLDDLGLSDRKEIDVPVSEVLKNLWATYSLAGLRGVSEFLCKRFSG